MTAIEPRSAEGRATADRPLDNGPRKSFGGVVRDYVALTKPRIIELLLVTTFPVMFLADRGVPSVWLILATLIGGSLSAGSANALNCYVDRDIDRLMHRTEGRPLATGAITPRAGLVFGIVMGVISVLWLGLLVNWLSAALSFGAIALYVGFYTLLLKRRTSQNIVWGGIAGCMPTLIGWSAVTNSVSWSAIVLFLVVFFWTPPHYWPLSMRFRDDYANAGVPMLPVVAEDIAVARQILVYTWVTVATTLALIPVADMGVIYSAIALISGVVFLREAHLLLHRARTGASYKVLKPMRLFHYSISYLTLVFVAVAVDPLLHIALH